MKKNICRLIAIFLLLVLALSTVGIASAAKGKHMPTSYELVGKAKIKGKMTEGIKITLMQDNNEIMHTFSNEKGRYTLENIDKGTYQLKAEFEGYEPKIKKNVKLTGKRKSKTRNMNINKKLIVEPEPTVVILDDVLDAMINGGGAVIPNRGFFTLNKRYDGNNEIRGVIKFDTSMIPQDADVQSAKLVITHWIYNAGNIATTDDYTYEVHKVLEDWDENIYFDNGGIPGQFSIYPMLDETVEATLTGNINGDKIVETDITDLVKEWVSGESENYGISLNVDSWSFDDHGDDLRVINNVVYGNGAPSATDEPRIIVEYY